MAGSYAGAYGAGAASDELHRLLSERMVQRRLSEDERSNKAREGAHERERADRATFAAQENEARARREFSDTQQRGEDRLERRRMFDVEQKRGEEQAKVRAKERADDREAGLEGEDRQRRFQREERIARQDFERRMMGAREASRSAPSEPLVAIKDPATGQPKLVPRSQAAGQAPASTRDQALTEGQSNAAGFADRMKFNEPLIQGYEGSIGRLSQLQSMMPREFQSAGLQQYESAKKNWIASQLRKESGAAISESEYAEADRQYFPQPGDGPEVVKQKRALRAVAQESMRRSSGTAGLGVQAPGAPGGSFEVPEVGGDLGAAWGSQ